jgi:hypothetical protein
MHRPKHDLCDAAPRNSMIAHVSCDHGNPHAAAILLPPLQPLHVAKPPTPSPRGQSCWQAPSSGSPERVVLANIEGPWMPRDHEARIVKSSHRAGHLLPQRGQNARRAPREQGLQRDLDKIGALPGSRAKRSYRARRSSAKAPWTRYGPGAQTDEWTRGQGLVHPKQIEGHSFRVPLLVSSTSFEEAIFSDISPNQSQS